MRLELRDIRTFSLAFAVLALVSARGCNQASPPPALWPASQPSPQAGMAPQAPSSPTPIAANLNWSQVSEQTACEAMNPQYCLGFYGISVDPSGRFQIGPSEEGTVAHGDLTPEERLRINTDLSTLLNENLPDDPHSTLACDTPVALPGVKDDISVAFDAQSGLTVYRKSSPEGSSCYRGTASAANALYSDLHQLLVKYYPLPFPPSPNSLTVVPPGTWAGPHAEARTTTGVTEFRFDCSHGSTFGPLILDESSHFNTRGTLHLDSGPILAGAPREFLATFSGSIHGNTMSLTLLYTGPQGNSESHDYTLELGGTAHFDFCPL